MQHSDRLIYAGGPGERRIALLRDRRVVGFVFDRFTPAQGDILLGRVLSLPAGLKAAFIDIGDDLPGFLARPGALKEGDRVLVQVTNAARRDKGATLSARPSLSGAGLVYDPFRAGVARARGLREDANVDALCELLRQNLLDHEGAVIRSRSADSDGSDLIAELISLRGRWRDLQDRAARAKPPAVLHQPGALARLLQEQDGIRSLAVDESSLLAEARALFPAAELCPDCWITDGAADALDQGLAREIAFGRGGRLIFDETAGATIVDVDGGAMAVMEANLLALEVIVAQIALRGLAGHILLDLIPANDRSSQTALLDRLRQLLQDDPAEVIGATRLGLIEVTRERRQPSLAEWFFGAPRPARSAASLALESLQVLLREALAMPAAHLSLQAAPPIIHYLDSRPKLLAETAARLGRPVKLVTRPDLTGFEVSSSP